MDKDRQEKVIIALKEKRATQPCPRCNNLQFEVISESMIPIPIELVSMADPSTKTPDMAQLPVVLVSCTNCGYIAHHAAGVLGLKR
jgi:hypothetical protein